MPCNDIHVEVIVSLWRTICWYMEISTDANSSFITNIWVVGHPHQKLDPDIRADLIDIAARANPLVLNWVK